MFDLERKRRICEAWGMRQGLIIMENRNIKGIVEIEEKFKNIAENESGLNIRIDLKEAYEFYSKFVNELKAVKLNPISCEFEALEFVIVIDVKVDIVATVGEIF